MPSGRAAPTLAIVAKTDAESTRERERLLVQFREGQLDDRMVELETRDRAQPQVEVLSNAPEEMDQSGIKEMIAGIFGQRTRKRR